MAEDYDVKSCLAHFQQLTAEYENVVLFYRKGSTDSFIVPGPGSQLIVNGTAQTKARLHFFDCYTAGSGTRLSDLQANSAVNLKKSIPYLILSISEAQAIWSELLIKMLQEVQVWTLQSRKWILHGKASPGSLLQLDELFISISGSHESPDFAAKLDALTHDAWKCPPIIAAVRLEESSTGLSLALACIDTFRGVFGTSCFVDNEIFSNLEAIVVQMNLKEMLILSSPGTCPSALSRHMKKYLHQWDVRVTEYKLDLNEHPDDLLRSSLEKFLFDPSLLSAATEIMPLRCLYTLVRHLKLSSASDSAGKYYFAAINLSLYAKLDTTALKALNILPTLASKGGDKASLFYHLNRCKTGPGSRALNQWLRQPLQDLEEIFFRQEIVACFLANENILEELRSFQLSQFPDLLRLAKKLELGRGSLQDVVRCYQVVQLIPHFYNLLSCIKDDQFAPIISSRFLEKFDSVFQSLSTFLTFVEATIDLKATERHEYIIKPEFDTSLADIHAERDRLLDDCIYPIYKAACRNLRLEPQKKIKLERSDIYGYFLRISRNDARVLSAEWKNTYEELSTQKNGIYFTTRELRDYSNQYQKLTESYISKQSLLVKEILNVASTYSPVFTVYNTVVAELDVLSSFAEVVRTSPKTYCRPTLYNDPLSPLTIIGGRHPTVEVEESVEFMPNDCTFSRASCTFQIITGPNMGGKSTYIRQVGMLALMAQVGCYIPAESAEMPIFDGIYARVGASDSQLKGISTFMAEMMEMSSILKNATARSLIIIDELGRGTSSSDGFALAWSISESIINDIRGYTLFATHFHELSHLEAKYPEKIKNYSACTCFAESGELILLYKIAPGIGDESFGIHVAELVQFPRSVVSLARTKALELGGTCARDSQLDHLMNLFIDKLKGLSNDIPPAAVAQELLKVPEISSLQIALASMFS